MIAVALAWLKMRYASNVAYLLTLQGAYELADLAEQREVYWKGEYDRLCMDRRMGGLFNTAGGELK